MRQLPQNISQDQYFKFVSQLVRQIPWGHNREIITKCNDIEEAVFYTQKTINNHWSRAVLVAQIETKLYHRQGRAIHNFEAILPRPMSDLAKETFKNPHVFDFLTIGKETHERDLEIALANQISKVLT